MAAGTDFQILLQAIEAYYGSGSDQWAQIFQYGVNADNAYEILAQTPGVTTIVSEGGNVLGYSVDKSITSTVISKAEEIGTAINSNTQLSTAVNSTNVNIPSHMEIIDVDGTMIAQSGSISAATGSVVKTVGTVAFNAVAGASVAATLGKTIDSILYNANPDFGTVTTWQSLILKHGRRLQQEIVHYLLRLLICFSALMNPEMDKHTFQRMHLHTLQHI